MFSTAIVLGLLGMAQPAIAVEPVRLAHTFAVDQADSYWFKAKVEGSMDIEVSSELNVKITAVLDDGTADAEIAMTKMELMINGSPMDSSLEPLKTKLDKFGMPLESDTSEAGVLYALFGACNYLPGSEVEIGKDFPIDWANKDSSATLKGSGQLTELKEKDGKQIAVVKLTGELQTPNGGSPSNLTSTCEFWLDSGQMVKAEGRLAIEAGDVSFSINPKL